MVFGERRCLVGWEAQGCHCRHSALMLGVEFYPWLSNGGYGSWLSTSRPHSPVIGNQSLAAIITAIKTINAL